MSEDERQIRELVAKWMEASKAGDTATVLSLMTDDAVFMVPGQAPFGKAAFAESSKAMTGMKIDAESEILELEICGDYAWIRNRLVVQVTPPRETAVVRRGYTLTIFRKTSQGRWLLARDANLLA